MHAPPNTHDNSLNVRVPHMLSQEAKEEAYEAVFLRPCTLGITYTSHGELLRRRPSSTQEWLDGKFFLLQHTYLGRDETDGRPACNGVLLIGDHLYYLLMTDERTYLRVDPRWITKPKR